MHDTDEQTIWREREREGGREGEREGGPEEETR